MANEPDKGTADGTQDGWFPRTQWTRVFAAREAQSRERVAILNDLMTVYWRPVYAFIRRKGCRATDAEDLTQSFFVDWLEKDLAGRADPARGRFRSLLLKSLSNFLKNEYRAGHAQRRRPPGGFVSIHELASRDFAPYQPVEHETPEAAFERNWVSGLIRCVLDEFEQECQATGRTVHYLLFRKRIVEPILEGAPEPPLEALAQAQGMTMKEASNRVITARRAFQCLLRKRVRQYAASEEEVSAEVVDLFRLLAGH